MSASPPRAWAGYKRLTALGFPRRFPIVQFPNPPLIVALIAAAAVPLLHAEAHSYARSISYLGVAVWAYEELTHGVNWFRRLLVLAFAVVAGVVAGPWYIDHWSQIRAQGAFIRDEEINKVIEYTRRQAPPQCCHRS